MSSEQTENVLIPCSIGITLLMWAFTCAIFIGTSQLATPDPYRDPGIYLSAGILLVILTPIGGYLASYGFLGILRNSRIKEDNTNE